MPLTDEQRIALFLAMHESIERAATDSAAALVGSGTPDLYYPPNHGFTSEEEKALRDLPASPALESALRKVIAGAAFLPLIDLLRYFDGVMDPEFYEGLWLGVRLEPIPEAEEEEEEEEPPFLYYDLGHTYWEWRERRPNPGWRLDTYEGESPSGSRFSFDP